MRARVTGAVLCGGQPIIVLARLFRHTPAWRAIGASGAYRGMGVHSTQPPQNRRTAKIKGLPATAATAARTAASNRRGNDFNGLRGTAANRRRGVIAHDPGAHVTSPAIILIDDRRWPLREQRLHCALEIGGLEALSLIAWASRKQPGRVIAGFVV